MSTPQTELAARIGRHIRNRMLSGVVVLVPLAITVLVLKLLYDFITAAGLPLVRPWLGELSPAMLSLIAAATMLIVVYVAGLVASFFTGRRLIEVGESLLLKLPVVKSIYSASRQVVDSFSASSLASFKAVVFVEFPQPGSRAMGFVTGTTKGPDGRTLYRVFVPAAVNPTSGFLLFLPESGVELTDIPIEAGVKMLVSAGVIAPDQYATLPRPDPSAPA